jgi:hypothetical protein
MGSPLRRAGRGGSQVSPKAWVRNRLIAGTLALFAARLILSVVRSGPLLVADEMGYLTNARVLAGGLAGQLYNAPFYRGGYSLPLWPLLKLSSDPGVAYHLVLILNAALAASVFPLMYLLLTRFAGVAPHIAIWAALVGATYPVLTVLSQVAMSENALFPLTCVWLIAFGGLLAARDLRGSLLWGVGLGASAAALWTVHGRMVTAVGLTALLVAWLGVRRRLHPAAVVAVLLVLAAGLWAAHLLNTFLIDHNYGGSAANEATDRVSSLWHGHALLTTAANFVGQAWYLVVSTFGLAAVVFARVVARARGAGAGGDQERLPPVIAILVALTVLLLVISAAAFPVRTRPDMLIYGRYVEIVTPLLIALGLAMLAGQRIAPRLFRPLLALALLSAVIVLIRATSADPGIPNRWNVAGLPFVTAQLGPAILIGAAFVAGAGAWLLGRVSVRGPRRLGAVALALFLPVVLYGAWNPVLRSQRDFYPSGWKSPEPVTEAYHIRSVGYDLDHYDTIGLYAFQWFLPHTSVRLFHGGRQPPPSQYFLSGHSWPREHPGKGAAALWSARGQVDQVLWRLGGS